MTVGKLKCSAEFFQQYEYKTFEHLRNSSSSNEHQNKKYFGTCSFELLMHHPENEFLYRENVSVLHNDEWSCFTAPFRSVACSNVF